MPRTLNSANSTDRMPGQATGKERILASAMLLFARMPYSDTSLRDIAAAAGVDVAYVHRAFGSKAEIFRQALLALAPADPFRQALRRLAASEGQAEGPAPDAPPSEA